MNHIRRKKGVNILKTFKKIIAVLLAGAGSFASAVPAMAAQPSYFTYTVKLPGKKAKTYSSRKTLNLSSAKASKSNAVIKLKSVYLRGRKASSSGMKISCMYTSSNGHIVSFTDGRKTLKISARLLKAIAGVGKSPSIALNRSGAYASGGAMVSARIKDTYSRDIFKCGSFYNIKMGRYGTAKTGISLTSSGFSINGKKRKTGTYSWWVAEYRPVNGTWTAADLIIAPKYPYGIGSAAYRLAVQRKGGEVTGMKITNALILTGDSGEVWASNSSAVFPAGWRKGKVFSYYYGVGNPKNVKAYSAKKGTITANWTPSKSADGYEFECSRNADFSLSRIQKYTGWSTSHCTAYGLHSSEKYYVHVRSRKTVNGKTYYSPWAKANAVKVL